MGDISQITRRVSEAYEKAEAQKPVPAAAPSLDEYEIEMTQTITYKAVARVSVPRDHRSPRQEARRLAAQIISGADEALWEKAHVETPWVSSIKLVGPQ